MASKTYRPRNPLKQITGPQAAKCPIPTKCHGEFTGKGKEAISGEGGGWLLFNDGKLMTACMAIFSRKWTLEDSAYCVHLCARHKAPADAETSAHLSNGLLHAVEAGDHEMFYRIAEVIRDPQQYYAKASPSQKNMAVMDAVTQAAISSGEVPNVQEVGAILYAIPSKEGTGHLYTTANRADKVREMLKNIGFQWLPGKKQGEHLRKFEP